MHTQQMTADGVGQHDKFIRVRQTQAKSCKVCLVGVVHHTDMLTSTLGLG